MPVRSTRTSPRYSRSAARAPSSFAGSARFGSSPSRSTVAPLSDLRWHFGVGSTHFGGQVSLPLFEWLEFQLKSSANAHLGDGSHHAFHLGCNVCEFRTLFPRVWTGPAQLFGDLSLSPADR
jgi:hypothetical protein